MPKVKLGKNVKKFEPFILVKIYKLAKAHMTQPDAAEALGVSKSTMLSWINNRPGVREAWDEGVRDRTAADGNALKHYCYNNLSPEMRRVWDEVLLINKQDNPNEQLDMLFSKHGGTKARQQMFVQAVLATNFNLTRAYRMVGVNYQQVKRWKAKFPEFAELMEELEWHKGNFFEEQFIDKVAQGESGMILHAVKTKLADRGYGTVKKHEHTGSFEHRHEHSYNIELLLSDVSIEARKEFLEAMRKQEALNSPRPELGLIESGNRLIEGEVIKRETVESWEE
jgi:hypothetical protein